MVHLLALVFMSGFGVSWTAAPSEVRRSVTVRVATEDAVTLDDDVLEGIAAELAAIWDAYADVTVIGPSDGRAKIGHEVRLVIGHRLAPNVAADALGWIDFVDGRPQPVFTVSLDAVSALMNNSNWRGRAVGLLPPAVRTRFLVRGISRAAAHELGHYLLQTTGHALRGLMKPGVTADDILSPRSGTDRLDRADALRLLARAR